MGWSWTCTEIEEVASGITKNLHVTVRLPPSNTEYATTGSFLKLFEQHRNFPLSKQLNENDT